MQQRVSIAAIVGLIALSVSSCATYLQPLLPGTALVNSSSDGLVFGAISIRRDGYLGRHGSITWYLVRQGSRQRFVISDLPEKKNFVLSLPPGQYRITHLIYEEGGDLWKGQIPANFTVSSGEVTYIGTWEIRFLHAEGGNVFGHVSDQLPQARVEMNNSHIEDAKTIKVLLLESAPEGDFRLVEFTPRVD